MMNVVMAVAPREKLGTYFSIGSSCIVLGPAFAPVMSGVMVTVGGWRAVFAPGCIVFAVLALAGIFVVKDVAEPSHPKLDAPSVALMAVGLVLLVLASGSGDLVAVVAAASAVYAGVGPAFAPSQTAGLRTLSPEANPHGVAIVNVCIQLAGCVGPALFVGVFSSAGFTAAVIAAGCLALIGFVTAFCYARASENVR